MTYVRIDTETQYIYFVNDTKVNFKYYDSSRILQEKSEMRSKYTLKTCFPCIRMTKKNNIPNDKQVCVWYNKGESEE